MDKQIITEFFNKHASGWDKDQERNDRIIREILDAAHIKQGSNVLDVGCGTGILFPDYLSRHVGSLTGADMSPAMIEQARRKFPEVELICCDAENYDFGRIFDSIVIYNAFPHFPSPTGTVQALSRFCGRSGGRLTVAHGDSRENIMGFHNAHACDVSVELPQARVLAEIFAQAGLKVDVCISDDEKYIVSGYIL